MNDEELRDYELRLKLGRGIQAAFNRMPGTGKLDKCARLGISNYALDKWVAGVSTPTDQNLARLSRLANVEQEWIRNGGKDVADEG